MRRDPFRVFVEDWNVEASGASDSSPDGSSGRLHACDGGLRLDLELRSAKTLVSMSFGVGRNMLSAKSVWSALSVTMCTGRA